MKKEVVFTEDFATKKKGETFMCDTLLANQLVTVDKVAKYKEKVKGKKEDKKQE